MIKTNNLNEYASLMAIKSYCECLSCYECEKCKIRDICDCMSVLPRDFAIEYVDEEGKEG